MKKQLFGVQFDEDSLLRTQEAVVKNYVKAGLIQQGDVQRVHMFFSPYRVPRGLTKRQLAIVVELSPLRDWQRNHLTQGSSASEPPFHYNPDELMSCQKFSNGIHQFLDQVHRELTVAKRFIFKPRKLGIIEHLRTVMGQKV